MNFTLATIARQPLVAMLQGTYHYDNISCQVRNMHPLETHRTILAKSD